jgi:hypothetical protein
LKSYLFTPKGWLEIKTWQSTPPLVFGFGGIILGVSGSGGMY